MLCSPCPIFFVPTVLCHWVRLQQIQHFYWEPRPTASVHLLIGQCLLHLHPHNSYFMALAQLPKEEEGQASGRTSLHLHLPSLFHKSLSMPSYPSCPKNQQREGRKKQFSDSCQETCRPLTNGFSEKYVQSLFQLCHQSHSAPVRKKQLSSKKNFSMRNLMHMERCKLKYNKHPKPSTLDSGLRVRHSHAVTHVSFPHICS